MLDGVKREFKTDDGSVWLMEGDALAIVPQLEGIGALISDPPYGIAYKKGEGGSTAGYKGRKKQGRNIEAIAGDDKDFDPSPWLVFPKVLLWGADHYAQRLPHGRFIAWDKIDGKPEWDSFSDVEFAWHNKRGAARIIRYLWKGMCQGNGEDKGSQRNHPTQKPVVVMRWSLDEAGVEVGELVCDPYMGSGTGIACIRTGRRFIGIEIDPKHYDTAVKRITDELSRTALFEPVPQVVQRSLLEDV